jgi:cytochrome c oxidase subunit 2
MIAKTGNPDFVYEVSCDQMCGKGHYSMRAVVIVETQAEHDAWLQSQQSYYQQNHATANPAAPATTDSVKKITMN